MEVVGAAAAAIAQASPARGQGGPINLQRFKTHHPPTFIGGEDPMVADIGFGKLRRYWRPWRSPLMRPRLD